MNSYLLSSKHINAIVTIGAKNGANTSFFEDQVVYKMALEFIAHVSQDKKDLLTGDVNRLIAYILVDYHADKIESDDFHSDYYGEYIEEYRQSTFQYEETENLTWEHKIKIVQHYENQNRDDDDWSNSLAYRYCQYLKDDILRQLFEQSNSPTLDYLDCLD